MTSVTFKGSASFSTSGSTVKLSIPEIDNNTNGTTGSLRVELWAFSSPYGGGSQTGYLVATYSYTQQLGPYAYYNAYSPTVSFTQPPGNYNYYTMALAEYTGQSPSVDSGYVMDDHINFSNSSGGGGGGAVGAKFASGATVSYQVNGSTVTLGIPEVDNNTNGTTGTLRAELWAFSSPYAGGSQGGYLVATYTYSQQLGPNTHYNAFSPTVSYTQPPSSYSYYTMALAEYTGQSPSIDSGYVMDDHINFSNGGGGSGGGPVGTSGDDILTGGGGNSIDGGSGFDTVTYSGNRANYTVSKVGSTVLVKSAVGTDTLTHIEYLQFADQPVTVAPSNTSNQFAALLYQGALGRTPDPTGLAYWVNLAENLSPATKAMGLYGLSDASGNYNGNLSIAGGFTQSAEFISKYGSLTNEQFATQLYANVLDRAPDPNGLNDWVGQLNRGTTREHVLIGFAESAEAISNASVGFVGIHGQHAAWLVLT